MFEIYGWIRDSVEWEGSGGGAAAFKKGGFKNVFLKPPFLKVQANFIRLLVKC